MKVGLMGAMKEEVESILNLMSDIKSIKLGGKEYHTGSINGNDVVLTFSGWGKVASSSSVTTLINEFKINRLLFVGVAGATDPGLNIGDIVASEKLYQHDMDARPLFKKGEIPLIGKTFFNADCALLSEAVKAANQFTAKIKEEISAELLTEFGILEPKCIRGVIASGDMFVGDPSKTSEILETCPETSAVEMEGAAVAQVCDMYKVEFVIIRIISDLANHSAHIDFPRFIAEVAKIYSANIIKIILDNNPIEEIEVVSEQTQACM